MSDDVLPLKYYLAGLVIVCMTLIQMTAFAMHIDGQVLSLVFGVIGAVVGAMFGYGIGRKGGEK